MDSLVDVMMPAYNHERFIAQAIEGVVLQNTNFRFRLIIGEDCSKDNTRAIIASYAAKYPDIVVPLFHEKNLGPAGNSTAITKQITAKYIALCEGDDYWIDNNKLQMQIDFMEQNPQFVFCFTSIKVVDGKGVELPKTDFFPKLEKDVFHIEDFILSGMNIIPSPTWLWKNVITGLVPDFYLKALSGDRAYQLLLADIGPAKYFPVETAVYRHHSGGISKSKENIEKGENAMVELFIGANEYFNYKYDATIKRKLKNHFRTKLLYGAKTLKGGKKIKHFLTYVKEYNKYSEKVEVKDSVYIMFVLFFPSLLKIKKS